MNQALLDHIIRLEKTFGPDGLFNILNKGLEIHGQELERVQQTFFGPESVLCHRVSKIVAEEYPEVGVLFQGERIIIERSVDSTNPEAGEAQMHQLAERIKAEADRLKDGITGFDQLLAKVGVEGRYQRRKIEDPDE